jgi:hypothetical protein
MQPWELGPNALGALKHNYANHVSVLFLIRERSESEYMSSANDCKTDFLAGMRSELARPLADVGDLTSEELKGYVALAESLDWTDPATLDTLEAGYKKLIKRSGVRQIVSLGRDDAGKLLTETEQME